MIIREPSSDRRQVYIGQLWESIIKWYGKFLSVDAYEMGVEIFDIIRRISGKENNTNVFDDKDEFFRYLRKSLSTGENEYFRNFESEIIKIPKEKKTKLKIIKNVLQMEESNLGKKLTGDEKEQFLFKWFKFKKDDYQEYIDLLSKENVGSLQAIISDSETEMLDFLLIPSRAEMSINAPHVDYFSKLDSLKIKNAIEAVLEKAQDRTRECYRSLFTAYCIDKSIDFDGLASLLDREILEAHLNNGESPKQREIYLKYHPAVKEESASVRASEMTKDFLAKLRSELNIQQ